MHSRLLTGRIHPSVPQRFPTLWVAVLLPLALAHSLHGEPLARPPHVIQSIQQGGYVIYFRHAATDHSQIDAYRIDFGQCATQRNLSPQGKAVMRQIGQAFRTLDIKIDRVLSSPFCRCIDSARLAFGEPHLVPSLQSSIRHGAVGTEQLAASLRNLLSTPPLTGHNTVIVGHIANLKDAADIWPQPEAVAHVFQPDAENGFIHIGQVLPTTWFNLSPPLKP